jgi:hypothetical protein
MEPIGRKGIGYTAKGNQVAAAAALFVALAAVPVLADTAQEKVISRLSCQTSTGEIGHDSQPGTTASSRMRQEPEQGVYQERFIRRISGETSVGAGREKSPGSAPIPPGTAYLQVSQQLERSDYREAYIRRLAGETFASGDSK